MPPLTIPFDLLQSLGVEAAAHYRPSRELWEMIDRNQRLDLPDYHQEELLSILPELTPEHLEAIAEADAAQVRMDERLAELHRRYAPRAADCGHTVTIVLYRERAGGGVENILARPPCKRSTCPHCWRRRIEKTLRRATLCLLDADHGSHSPRLGKLYFAEVPWERWEAYDRAMRREIGGDSGRMRIRRHEGSVLVIGEQPWAGAKPISPSQAVDLAAEAIDSLHTARHSYRQLGSWADEHKSDWECLGRVKGGIDLAEVARQLEAVGIRSRRFRSTDMQALLWRADTADASLAVLMGFCPTLDKKRKGPFKPKSDKPPDEAPPEAKAEPDWWEVPDSWEPGGFEP